MAVNVCSCGTCTWNNRDVGSNTGYTTTLRLHLQPEAARPPPESGMRTPLFYYLLGLIRISLLHFRIIFCVFLTCLLIIWCRDLIYIDMDGDNDILGWFFQMTKLSFVTSLLRRKIHLLLMLNIFKHIKFSKLFIQSQMIRISFSFPFHTVPFHMHRSMHNTFILMHVSDGLTILCRCEMANK